MRLFLHGLSACVLLSAGAFFTGCASSPDTVFLSDTSQSPPPSTSPIGDNASTTNSGTAVFNVGDTVNVVLSDAGPDFQTQTYEQIVKEDGNISLPLIGNVQAVNETVGQLEQTIHDLYVPKYYVRLTVTVKPSTDRVFYVGGEVNHPGVFQYLGTTTVTKAIQTAGDLDPYSSHTVWLIRPNSKPVKVNYDQALKDPTKDLQVYPGDQINVPRRLF
ncbi:MAG TPA: polysaccharide biosynthesis/export family protein [Candidatus Saccharimonadales bacterium]|nr:polysaccharide biosynthesis/export family protein [Candidatus Saccharimonadales bacterium]HUB86778.1 polysaccharide biosynthesis/export family protein [Verrucomicrobiae bacterium]